MWEQFWHDAVRSLGPVYFCLAIVFVVTTVIRKRLDAQRKLRLTYVLSDGGQNSVYVTLDAWLSDAEHRRDSTGIWGSAVDLCASFQPEFGTRCKTSALGAKRTSL
jgi:hypothetical protein